LVEMKKLDDMSREEVLLLIQDAFRNIVSHTGLWFQSVKEELGLDEAIQLDEVAWQSILPTRSKRFVSRFALDEEKGIPGLLSDWNREQLISLLEDLSKDWLANDGVWFQAVEDKYGMTLAKKLNDKTWGSFTVVEAKRIMSRLRIPENGGLNALEQALGFRLYARVNRQETLHEGSNRLIFRMNDCRVQSARKRKNLPDYPCKSVGIIEYPYFARAIDPRIETTCIACPPDPHPKEYYCAWQFELK